MADILLKEPSSPDVFAYDFDKYLNRNIAKKVSSEEEKDSNSTVYNQFTTINPAQILPGPLTVTQLIINGSSAGVPGGSNTEVQFNSSGSFGADSDFTYNSSTNQLKIQRLIGVASNALILDGYVATSVTGAGGGVTLTGAAGGATSGSGGSINLTGGDNNGGAVAGQEGGDVNLQAGVGAGTGTGAGGGDINITAGEYTGAGGTSSQGGDIGITAGSSTGSGTGDGGSVTIIAGSTAGRDGGDVNIFAGDTTGTREGGVITLFPGSKGTGGTLNGYVEIGVNTAARVNGATADDYAQGLKFAPTYTAASAQTLTRHNYMDLQNPSVTNVTITDAAVMRFDAAAGTHKAVDSGTTKTTPGGVDAWVKININGTIYYVAGYTSKTA